MRRSPRQNLRRWVQGLTLGEMLVVLAVFMILVVIFFMSSSHAMNKARLSRVLKESKDLANALQLYQNEYADLPTQTQGWKKLKSPVAFMPYIPVDPFNAGTANPREYIYISDLSPQHRCLIVSVGPDGKSDVEDALDEMRQHDVRLSQTDWSFRSMTMSAEDAKKFIIAHSYDPTNGTTSAGDVITHYQP